MIQLLDEYMKRLLTVFKLLSDETRLRIIVLLKQEQLSVCEICGILEQPQPKVSKHLAKLRDLGLAVGDRKEQFIFYSLRLQDPPLCNLIDEIIGSINNYPVLLKDSIRLRERERETYLDNCRVDLLKLRNK